MKPTDTGAYHQAHIIAWVWAVYERDMAEVRKVVEQKWKELPRGARR